MFRVYMKLAATVAAGILGAKVIEAGGCKLLGKGREMLDKRNRKDSEEDKED